MSKSRSKKWEPGQSVFHALARALNLALTVFALLASALCAGAQLKPGEQLTECPECHLKWVTSGPMAAVHLEPGNTSVTSPHRFLPVVALSATNAPSIGLAKEGRRVKGIRQFNKECPNHEGEMLYSTNVVWSGSHTAADGHMVKDGTVTFQCQKGQEGEKFSEAITQDVRKTPLVELPPLPPP